MVNFSMGGAKYSGNPGLESLRCCKRLKTGTEVHFLPGQQPKHTEQENKI